MKTIILAILITLSLTGCFQTKTQQYNAHIDRYLADSRAFNTEYKLTHTIQPYTWYKLLYEKDTADIMRCPEYTTTVGKADCDGFAYLSTIQETDYPFAFFLVIMYDGGGHMVAFYQESPSTYTVYSNKTKLTNQTLSEYIATYSNVKYTCKIDITLHRIKGGN
jgi:hypothetical protein